MGRPSVMRLAASVGMAVAPGPVLVLFFAVEAIEFAILVMTFSEPHAVGAILAGIPVVIIGIVRIVDADSGGATRNGDRSKRSRGKEERAEKAFVVSHGMSPGQQCFSHFTLGLGCEMLAPE